MNCLVLRRNYIDREMLKKLRIIHRTFPNESLDMYISKLCANDKNMLDSNKLKASYEKSLISTKEKFNQKDPKCTDLRTKILKDNHDLFKDKAGTR